MNITRIAVKRPLATLMLFLAVVIMGVVAYTELPVQRLPNVNFPHVTVVLRDPGASPQTMRIQVVDPVEHALTKIGGIVTMDSNITQGSGRISLRFPGGTKVSKVANLVADVVNGMTASLPVGTEPPTIIKADPNALPVMDVAVYGSLDPASLYNLVSNTIAPAFMAIPGVARVNLIGGHAPQVNVDVNPARLEQYGVPLTALGTAIAAQDISRPAGTNQAGGKALPVQVQSSVSSLSQLSNIFLPAFHHTTSASGSIPISDVATVTQGYAPVTTVSHLNGDNAIGLVISLQSGANDIQVSQSVHQVVADLHSHLPLGVSTVVTGDITQHTRMAMTATQADLFFAILAAGIMLALWLHRMRLTIVVLLTIPATLCATFVAMYAMRFSLDSISLMALGLLIGILVDDAIVVLENIVRHYSLTGSSQTAAINGRSEIAGAALAITLTDVVVYAPVAFMKGNIGQLFREFGLTIVFATLFSLFVSFTLTPLLAAHFGLRQQDNRPRRFESWWNTRFSDLQAWYERGLRLVFRRWWMIPVIAAAALLFDWQALSQSWVPTTYTPAENSSVFFVNMKLPPGTGIATTDVAVSHFSNQIRKIHGVSSVFATTGYGNGSAKSSNIGRLTVDIDTGLNQPSVYQVIGEVQAVANQIPGVKIQTSIPNDLVSGGGGPALSIVLQGTSLTTLDSLANRMQTMLGKISGVTNIMTTAESLVPQLSVQVNPQSAAAYGLTTQEVGQALHIALQGKTVGAYQPTLTSSAEPVVLEVSPLGDETPESLSRIPVGDIGGKVVDLGEVASVEQVPAPVKEQESDGLLKIQVTADTGTDALGPIAAQVRKQLKAMALPSGYTYTFRGAVNQKARTFGPLTHALSLAVVLIYMVLAGLYEDFFDPLAVLCTLPLALTGALFGLLVTRIPFSLYAFIAVIMLTGLVSKNAILLIDYAKRAVRNGDATEMKEALIAAGRLRLRPILMTTGTMVLAMLPLALNFGAGASDRMPMAIVLIFGMLSGTLLTLFILPPVYLALNSIRTLIRRGKIRS